MRSWKTPALLATVGLCGLGSLFAQGPLLPSLSEPTPVYSSTLPMQDLSAPMTFDQNPVAPAPVYENAAPPMMEQPLNSGAPIYGDSPVYQETVNMQSAPGASCGGCDTAGPAPVSDDCCSAPSCGGELMVQSLPPVQQMYAPPMISQPSCGCQGHGSSAGSDLGGSLNSGYSSGYAPGYSMGSGSGVSSGILSPNANSGGLHTRYPYYNYRHPWHYQGPPSQNVTIVW